MNIKKNIPNAITCGNLLCGCLALVSIFNGDLITSAILVSIAAILDFFDGFAARILKVSGEMGKQLDSLADMVTFGVVPGATMFKMMNASQNNVESYLPYFAFLITIFSALRLAKFNIDTRQSSSFIGVPTPASSLLICTLPLINRFQFQLGSFYVPSITLNFYFLLLLAILISYLMVAELPLFALKFKTFGWADNIIRYVFLISSLLLLIVFHFIAIPIIIFLYIVLSIINNIKTKNEIQSRN